MSRNIGFGNQLNLVPSNTKCLKDLNLGSSGLCRALKSPLIAIYHARKTGTGFVRISANDDDRLMPASRYGSRNLELIRSYRDFIILTETIT